MERIFRKCLNEGITSRHADTGPGSGGTEVGRVGPVGPEEPAPCLRWRLPLQGPRQIHQKAEPETWM